MIVNPLGAQSLSSEPTIHSHKMHAFEKSDDFFFLDLLLYHCLKKSLLEFATKQKKFNITLL